MKKEVITQSAEETTKLGESFAKEIKNGGIICLSGDLGSGKTTFTQGIAKGLGIMRRVTSPTFVVVRRQSIPNKKEVFFWHVDLYRLRTLEEAKNLGLEEMWQGENIVIIEWPEIVKSLLPKNAIEINIEATGQNSRLFKFKNLVIEN